MTAQQIADEINANCQRYNAGEIDYETWSAEQFRLWREADHGEPCIIGSACEAAIRRWWDLSNRLPGYESLTDGEYAYLVGLRMAVHQRRMASDAEGGSGPATDDYDRLRNHFGREHARIAHKCRLCGGFYTLPDEPEDTVEARLIHTYREAGDCATCARRKVVDEPMDLSVPARDEDRAYHDWIENPNEDDR